MQTRNEPSLQELDAIRSTGLRPQVVACLINKKSLLFVFHKEYDLWQLPQGGIKNKETAPQALQREIGEELGESAQQTLDSEPVLVTTEQINFPKEKFDVKKLALDDGTNITMKGKFYFAYAIQTQDPTINIEETQFDDYKWCSRIEANTTTETIYQLGKQRITKAIVQKLAENGMIE